MVARPAAPVVAFSEPAAGTVLTASDTLTGTHAFSAVHGLATASSGASIIKFVLYVDGEIQQTSTTVTIDTLVSLALGKHTLGLEATDNFGTVSPRTSIDVSVVVPTSATPIPVDITLPTFGNGEAGTLPGSLNVGNDGAAGYNIDFVVPPGTANMQPKLSLNYSSNGSNGMVGLGWSLGGLSTIHRCVKTIAQDGYPGRISFDTGDRLCLDGMRLMRFDGSSTSDDAYWQGQNGAQYRTEIESFARITRLSNGGFKVELKDGRIQYYGIDANSAIAAQGRTDGQPLLWALARTEDRSGNYMTYEYAVDSTTGEYLPKQIRYGGNTNANQVADLAVRFQQDVRTDAQMQYMGGSRNDLRNRLTHVRTYVNTATDGSGGTLARDYTIGYTQSANSARSLVDYVQVCGDDGKCLPKTQMGWGTNPIKMVEKYEFLNYVQGDDDSVPNKSVSGDFDGSGKTTILYAVIGPGPCVNCVSLAPHPLTGQLLGIRDVDGHISNVNSNLTIPAGNTYSEMISGDMNGDGRDDLVLVDIRSRAWVYCLAVQSADTSPAFAACQPGGVLPAARDYSSRPGDVPNLVSLRNDGKAQLIALDKDRNLTIFTLDNNVVSSVTKPTNILGGVPSLTPILDLIPISLSKQGMSDFYSAWTYPNLTTGGLSICHYNQEILTCKVIINGGSYGSLNPADVNGDGLTDTFSSGTGCLSTETDVDCRAFGSPSPTYENQFMGPADLIGNGVNMFWGTHPSAAAQSLCQIVDNATICHPADASALAATSLTQWGDTYSMPFFIDDSGIPATLNCSVPLLTDGQYTEHCRVYSAAAAANEDRLTSVVNGVGQREEVDYARGDDATVYSRHATLSGAVAAPTYPQMSTSAGTMVKALRRSNGHGGWIGSSYRYTGAMYDASGRGSLGFTTVSTTDANNITTDTTLSQIFPYVGLALHIVKNRTQCLMSDTYNTLETIPFGMNAGGQTVFVDIKQTNTSETLDCNAIRNIATSNRYTDGWGNLNDQTVTTTWSSGVRSSSKFDVETTTVFYTDANYVSGLPLSVKTKRTDSVTGTLTRTATYQYDGNGLITQKAIEPDNSALTLTTLYGRASNVYGLINTQTQTWTNPACADSTWTALKSGACTSAMRVVVADIEYDTKGRFVTSAKNALGQSDFRTYDAKSGAQVTRIDANQLQTSWTVDSLGRVTVEQTPDQNQKRVNLRDCQGTCPNGATVAQITEFFNGTSRIVPPQIAYLDSAGHPVRAMTWGFDGRTVVSDQRFDALGRLSEADYPRFENDAAYLAKRIGYDDLNRVTSTTTVDTGGIERTATTTYVGLVIRQTNLNNQQRTETHDVIGQLTQVQDSNAPVRGLTQFVYDPFGNLIKTIDPNGNVISVSYDLLGRRIALNDPDLGMIIYGVDPAGRTWSQESPNHRAKGKKAYTEFDLLGRMVGRYEPDLESHWVFDTANYGVGQLAEAYTVTAAGKDYSRTVTYDAVGRPSGAAQKLTDATYTSGVEYDIWGRPVTSTYQRGTDAKKIFSTRYNNFGYMARVERASLVLWNVMAQDASGRPTSIALGNGLVQSKFFNVHTGRLDKGDASAGTVARVQEGYDYDSLGNVTTRSQAWDSGSFMETMQYDMLNRLVESKIGNAEKLFTYDLAGNIQSKTGTGTYAYPAQGAGAIRPHAVSTVTLMGSADQYGYDDNGNLTSGPTSGTWTSFDMPIRLAKGPVWADFTYGPEHQRTSQHRSDGSWVYYAGAQEVETNAAGTTVRTYWPNGIGVEIDRGTSATEMSWSHVDRLGSPIALTDEAGAIREKLEYDVWGKRRSTGDNDSTPDSVDGKTDNRGFTGHEMLDQLDLIHMNGRVYNPLIGKFLSGDPLIQDPINGQSYNRFSYVLNNPTNITDPTGFSPLIGGCTWENFCESISFSDPGVKNGKSNDGNKKSATAGTATARSQTADDAAKKGVSESGKSESVVASGQQGDWNEGGDDARQKQLAALPKREVDTVVGEPGQDEMQVVRIAASKMRDDAMKTDFENCGSVCAGNLGQGPIFGINIQSSNSHLACAVSQTCPAGLVPTGRNAHTHGRGTRFKVSKVDNILSNNSLEVGKIISGQSTDEFSVTDLLGSPGYLITDKEILFHKGQDTENMGTYK